MSKKRELEKIARKVVRRVEEILKAGENPEDRKHRAEIKAMEKEIDAAAKEAGLSDFQAFMITLKPALDVCNKEMGTTLGKIDENLAAIRAIRESRKRFKPLH